MVYYKQVLAIRPFLTHPVVYMYFGNNTTINLWLRINNWFHPGLLPGYTTKFSGWKCGVCNIDKTNSQKKVLVKSNKTK